MASGKRGDLPWRHVHWPDVDRAAWCAANQPGDDFDEAGKAFIWTEASRRNVEQAYGRFLQFLERNGALLPAERVRDRLDLAQIKLFRQELGTKVAPSTVWGILQALSRAFSAMAPEADRTTFHKVLTRIKKRTRLSRQLDGRLITPTELIAVANRMMDEAETKTLGVKAAVLYRNGAIIMGAAYCPLRRDAWGKLVIGQHLHFSGNGARITFKARELKATKRRFEVSLPPDLVIRLARYISHYRPLLLPQGKVDEGNLWITWTGDPLHGKSLSSLVYDALAKRCGKNFSFHMFRHSAATFIEDNAPEQSLMIAGVLHHADFKMAEEHYIRGQRTAAMRTFQSCVREIVRKGRGRKPKSREAGRRGLHQSL